MRIRGLAGEAMVLRDNFFLEQILPKAVLRTLSVEEMAEYRRPFAEPGEGRRPTLTWPRQIPIEGEPADVTAIAAAYADWLATSGVPKLFVKAEPGLLVAGGAKKRFLIERASKGFWSSNARWPVIPSSISIVHCHAPKPL
jgi:haloalkane dehalogenase